MTFLHCKPATEGRPRKKKTNQNVRSRHFEHIYKNIMYIGGTFTTSIRIIYLLWRTKTVGRPKKGGKKTKPKTTGLKHSII